MIPDLAEIAEWARKNGALPAQMEQPPALPPAPPPAATVDAPAAAAPTLDPLTQAYQAYADSMAPERLDEAIAANRRNLTADTLESGFNRAAQLIGRLPSQAPTTPKWDAIKEYALRQQNAQARLGAQMQVAQMSPTSPLAQAKLQGLRAAGIDLPPGTSPLVADSYLAALKAGLDPAKLAQEIAKGRAETESTYAGIPKIRSEADKAAAEAAVAAEQAKPLSPEARAALESRGITVPKGTSAAVAEKLTGPQVTRLEGEAQRANAIELKRMEIEQWRTKLAGEHPRAVAPGWTYRGPKLAPDQGDVDAFLGTYVPATETVKNLDAYRAAWEQAAKDPTKLVDPGWRQMVTTLYESTFPAIAKKNAGGNAAPLAEIGAAQEALAKPGVASQALGMALSKVRRSVETLKAITNRDIDHVAHSHFIERDAPQIVVTTDETGARTLKLPDGTVVREKL